MGATATMSYRIFMILIILFINNISQAQQTFPGGGLGSYNKTFPPGPYIFPNNPAPGVSHYQYPGDDFARTGTRTPKVVPGFTGPIPTHEWWSSAIWNYENGNPNGWQIAPYSFTMHPHPLSIGATRYGLKMYCETNPVVNSTDYMYSREFHLYVGLAGMDVPPANGTRVKSYGDWSTTLQWNDGAGRILEATSGHGFPFVYFTKSAGQVVTLRYQVPPSTFATATVGTVSATGITINIGGTNYHYGIFMPTGTTVGATYPLMYNEANLAAELGALCCVNRNANNYTIPAGQNYFSIAALPDNNSATLSFYAQHAFAFVTDTKVTYSYNTATAKVISTFTATTTPQGTSTETRPLMALYRHQWINSSASLTTYNYSSTPRGEMKVFQGNSFSTSMTNHGLLPSMPHAGNYNNTTLYNYIQSEYTQPLSYHLGTNLGPYTGGTRLQRLCDLIHIAHQVKHYAARDAWRTHVKNYLQNWFSAPAGKSDDMFYYDNTWNTLVAYPSAFESDRQLNDHHFHYGYFIKAAATIAQYEPNNTWVTQWGPMVETIIKDVANWDRADLTFPYLRNFDPYAGHSWASGHANFLKGNNQESSSEALNFASAVVLWGTNTGNNTLRDLGLFLYVNEVEATRQYWFDVNNAVFPATFGRTTAGIVWGWGVEYRTWFGGPAPSWSGVHPEYVHGIQFLPFSGASLYLGLDPSYVTANYNEMVANNGGPETDWEDIFWNFQALANSAASKAKFAANAGTYIPMTGETKAHTYHWIHNLDSMGFVDATVTADIPTYSVFYKTGCKHYVVYNAGSTPVTANFSDGNTFAVPADTLIVFRPCGTLPVQLLNFTGRRSDKGVELNWVTSWEENNDHFVVERSHDGIHFETVTAVKGKGDSKESTYYYTLDPEPFNTVSYYRLKQVDMDGKYSYSNIITINSIDGSDNVSIYPNPAHSNIHIGITTEESKSVYLSLADMLGRKIISNRIYQLHSGVNEIHLNLEELSSGTYILQIINEDGSGKKDIKFVKE
ncbi:MAG: T9SS type A sorting domain-containing protein [Cytophagaceae bacterium]|nr:T9SS type A sorting domain-containing protein [Cytophagaceae bacterium]